MSLELWGGIECTVNRVNSRSFDQLVRSGHDQRLDDLDRFAALGLKTLRYPVLWERVQPNAPDEYDWRWSDERLGRLQELGIRPIVGLLHHGSGPSWTDLLDPHFPVKLARYALEVARRYPWVDAYVPVNEPLTTARFSGLYGLWYPHRKDNSSFVQALLNQIEGISLSMKAIRSVHPRAELVQTEDLGKTFSTPALRYQAEFENERRWITFDLLTGRFSEDYPLWTFLRENGADCSRLERFAREPCPPDIHGVNYYVTSERYLDECLESYPRNTHGRNAFQAYADVNAVRTRPDGILGLGALLREHWDRYGAPMAVTEAHIGCTREEQVRWLVDTWNQCRYLAENGIECRAVTAWALLGTFDWNSLVVEERGDYEPGAFDVRTGEPRPTAMARVIRTLAAGKDFISPILRTHGWWRRPERLAENLRPVPFLAPALSGPPILVIGAEKGLGEIFSRVCENRGLACRLVSKEEVDIDEETSVLFAQKKYRPWAFIDASTYVPPDLAGKEQNGAVVHAYIFEKEGKPCLTFSRGLGLDPDHESNLMISTQIEEAFLFNLCHATLDFLIDSEIGLWRLEPAASSGCFQNAG